MMTKPQDQSSSSHVFSWHRLSALWRKRENHEQVEFIAVQRQFLPGALAVQQTPPSPAAHWVLGLLFTLFGIAVLWACIGEVDIVVTAPGRIVPSGQVKTVQASEAGIVASIFVKDGQQVRKGQALVKLDPTYADADSSRLREQLLSKKLQLLWREALDRWLASGRKESLNLRFSREVALASRQRTTALYQQQQSEITARMDALHSELGANLAEQNALRAQRDKTTGILAVLIERVAAYKALLDKQYGARAQYLEILQQQTELELSIPVLRSRKQQLEETAAALAFRSLAAEGELRRKNLVEIVRLDAERASLEQESLKAEQRQQQLLLTSPVNGTVLGLQLHTIGGVVAPAQVLMKIVPDNVSVEVEAFLQNKDIGFVHEEQQGEVKINTFNFTKYGLIDAITTDISSDAIEDQKLGWVFKMRLKLRQDRIAVEDKWVKLSPGMAVTVELKIGKRRLIEFFLSPLLRYRQESVRER
jgi:hemolysin D